MNILEIVLAILALLCGGLCAYYKSNGKLQSFVAKYIAEAEELYSSSTKSGGEKFKWVVDKLYSLLPAPIKIIIPKSVIETIVQNTFDAIKKFAEAQLDKVADNIPKEIENNG